MNKPNDLRMFIFFLLFQMWSADARIAGRARKHPGVKVKGYITVTLQIKMPVSTPKSITCVLFSLAYFQSKSMFFGAAFKRLIGPKSDQNVNSPVSLTEKAPGESRGLFDAVDKNGLKWSAKAIPAGWQQSPHPRCCPAGRSPCSAPQTGTSSLRPGRRRSRPPPG